MKIAIAGQIRGRIVGRPSGQLILGQGTSGKVSITLEGRGYRLAKAARKKEMECKLITWIGKDIVGKSALLELERDGVDLSYVRSSKDQETIMSLEVKNQVDELDLGIYCENALEEEKYPWEEIGKQVDGIIFDGSFPVKEMEKAMEETSVFFAFAPEGFEQAKRGEKLLEKMEFLFLDRQGGEVLCDMDILSQEQVKQAGRFLVGQGVKEIVFLLGKGGIYSFKKDEEAFYSAEELMDLESLISSEEVMINWLEEKGIRE